MNVTAENTDSLFCISPARYLSVSGESDITVQTQSTEDFEVLCICFAN